MDGPLASKKAPKSKRPGAKPVDDDDDDEASETAQPIRWKGIPQQHKALPTSKDKGKGNEVGKGSVAESQAVEGEADTNGAAEVQKDVEMVEVAENTEVEDEGDYIHDAHVARLGLINNFRISQYDEKFSKIAYTRIDYHDDKGVGQTEEQSRFESLFMKLGPDRNAGELPTTNRKAACGIR